MSWSEILTVIGLTTGTLIAVLTLVQKYIWPFIKIVNVAAKLVDYELKHNGGYSVKDQLRYIDLNLSKLVEADSLTSAQVQEIRDRLAALEAKVEAAAEAATNVANKLELDTGIDKSS